MFCIQVSNWSYSAEFLLTGVLIPQVKQFFRKPQNACIPPRWVELQAQAMLHEVQTTNWGTICGYFPFFCKMVSGLLHQANMHAEKRTNTRTHTHTHTHTQMPKAPPEPAPLHLGTQQKRIFRMLWEEPNVSSLHRKRMVDIWIPNLLFPHLLFSYKQISIMNSCCLLSRHVSNPCGTKDISQTFNHNAQRRLKVTTTCACLLQLYAFVYKKAVEPKNGSEIWNQC